MAFMSTAILLHQGVVSAAFSLGTRLRHGVIIHLDIFDLVARSLVASSEHHVLGRLRRCGRAASGLLGAVKVHPDPVGGRALGVLDADAVPRPGAQGRAAYAWPGVPIVGIGGQVHAAAALADTNSARHLAR